MLDVWLARMAIVIIAGLQLLLINDLWLGPRWLAPAIELAMLLPLSVATAWHHERTRRAREDRHWAAIDRHRRAIRRAAIALTGVVSLVNLGALVLLVRALLAGTASGGPTLLVDAINVWSINVIVFALWYWGIDRAQHVARGADRPPHGVDFLFPQYTLPAELTPRSFTPGFVDYLFVSFTNATAFSPTDTLPLTRRAKLLMMAEAAISLLTVALVAARAVNILA